MEHFDNSLNATVAHCFNLMSAPEMGVQYLNLFSADRTLIAVRLSLCEVDKITSIDNDNKKISYQAKLFRKIRNGMNLNLISIDIFSHNFSNDQFDFIVADLYWNKYLEVYNLELFYVKLFGLLPPLLNDSSNVNGEIEK